jgi:hypothetical protein
MARPDRASLISFWNSAIVSSKRSILAVIWFADRPLAETGRAVTLLVFSVEDDIGYLTQYAEISRDRFGPSGPR